MPSKSVVSTINLLEIRTLSTIVNIMEAFIACFAVEHELRGV